MSVVFFYLVRNYKLVVKLLKSLKLFFNTGKIYSDTIIISSESKVTEKHTKRSVGNTITYRDEY